MGKKRIDRRGCVGTHHYTDIQHLSNGVCDLEDLKNKYTFIAIDNNVNKTHKLRQFDWNKLENITGGVPVLIRNGKVIRDFSSEKTINSFLLIPIQTGIR